MSPVGDLPAAPPGIWERRLVWFLRITGIVTGMACLAVPLPRAWMASAHVWLGLGAFPEAPVVDYLARSLSACYALLGGLLWVLARDPRRMAPLLNYLALAALALGPLFFLIDWCAGLPAYWALVEGPFICLLGGALYLLKTKAERERAEQAVLPGHPGSTAAGTRA